MKLLRQWILIGPLLAALGACATTGPADYGPVVGTVERIIDADHRPAQPAPCLAGAGDRLAQGRQFAAIRYRKWASHFVTTVYAEVPVGMAVRLHQKVEIEPAQCGKNQLAVIVGEARD